MLGIAYLVALACVVFLIVMAKLWRDNNGGW